MSVKRIENMRNTCYSNVSTGAAALLQIEAAWSDLMILDMTLPDGDVIELLFQVRAKAAGRDLPIILLPPAVEPGNSTLISQMAWLGVKYYLAKPFNPLELAWAVAYIFCDKAAEDDRIHW